MHLHRRCYNANHGFMRRRGRSIGAGIVVAVLSACTTLTPGYQRQAMPVSAQWRAQSAVPGQNAAVDIPWRELFADGKLREVVQIALDNNRDLRIAALKIERARAQYRIRADEWHPQWRLSAEAHHAGTPDSVRSSGIGGIGRAFRIEVGFSAYELDLFGRLHSLEIEALETYFATAEARRAIHIALISEVASAYMTLAADGACIDLARDTVHTREKTYNLQRARSGRRTAASRIAPG